MLELLQKEISNHLKECPRRQYECPHCGESGEYRERTTAHLEDCPMVEVPCPKRRCSERLPRCDVPQHRKECLFEEVPCKYSNIGCDKLVLRKDLQAHEGDSQQHLQLAIDTVHQLRMAVPSSVTNYRVNNFDILKSSSEPVYSPAFYTGPGGYRMCIKVCANGNGDGKDTHVSVFAYLMRGANDDHLPWPFTGRVTIELLNQLEDKNHRSTETTFSPDKNVSERVVDGERSSHGYGHPCFIRHSSLGYDETKHCQYLKDDHLYFRIKVDTASSSKPWLVNN